MDGTNGDKSIQRVKASIVLVSNASFIKYRNYCINKFNLAVNGPNSIGPYLAKHAVCLDHCVQIVWSPTTPNIKSKYLSIWLEILQNTKAV